MTPCLRHPSLPIAVTAVFRLARSVAVVLTSNHHVAFRYWLASFTTPDLLVEEPQKSFCRTTEHLESERGNP